MQRLQVDLKPDPSSLQLHKSSYSTHLTHTHTQAECIYHLWLNICWIEKILFTTQIDSALYTIQWCIHIDMYLIKNILKDYLHTIIGQNPYYAYVLFYFWRLYITLNLALLIYPEISIILYKKAKQVHEWVGKLRNLLLLCRKVFYYISRLNLSFKSMF